MGTRDQTQGWIEIDAAGVVRATPAVMRRLARSAGLWRLLPPAGRMRVLLQANDDPGAAARAASEDGVEQQQIVLCGSLDEGNALAGILNLIRLSSMTGEFHVIAGPLHRVLYCQGGTLLSARSNVPEHRIGALLVRDGVIAAEDLDRSLAQSGAQQKLGQLLVDRGLLTTHQLYEAIQRQSTEIFFSTLVMTNGAFYLVQPIDAEQVASRLRLDVEELLLDGLRRLDEMSYLKTIVPDLNVVLRRQGGASDLVIEDMPGRLYELVDGRRTLGDAMTVLGLDEFAAMKAAAELVQRSLVKVESADQLRRARSTGAHSTICAQSEGAIAAYNDALRRLCAAFDGEDREKLVRQIDSFVREKTDQHGLFEGVAVAGDGALDKEKMLANALAIPEEERAGQLQLSLNELLFFALFAAGDELDPNTEEDVQREVAQLLKARAQP